MKNKIFFMALLVASFSGCQKEEPTIVPTARFAYTTKDLTVSFTNQSSNAISYSWDFGDNTPSCFESSPSHTYSQTGSYNVTLTVKSKTGNTDKFSQSISLIPNASETPTANFSYSPLKPYEKQRITLTNNSTKASSYLWDFGNNKTSTEKAPSLSMDAGTWTITLIAYSADKSLKDACTKTINVLHAPKVMKINSYKVNSIDFEDANGRYWDDSSKDGPDIFIKSVMRDGTAIDLKESGNKSNVTTSDIPYSRTLGWRLSYFSATYKFRMYDYDSWSDDWMADFSLKINDYIPVYPSEITLRSGKFSITLFVEWQAE